VDDTDLDIDDTDLDLNDDADGGAADPNSSR
jgi:hypothetical protein